MVIANELTENKCARLMEIHEEPIKSEKLKESDRIPKTGLGRRDEPSRSTIGGSVRHTLHPSN